MADEPVAGVSVEVGGDAEGFFAALDKCGKAAEQFNRRVNNAFEKITGVKATQQAEILAKGLEKAGGVAKLTAQQIERLRAEVDRLAKAGARLPDSLKFPTMPGLGQGAVFAGNIQTQALAGLQGQLGPLGGLLTGITGSALAAGAGVAAFTVAAGAAGKAVADAVQEFASFSSHLNDLSATTGLSTTALQELSYVGSFARVSIDEISAAVAKMETKVIEGDSVFKRLGLDIEELRAMRPEEVFFRVAEAISKIQDPALKITLAKEAFDKLGPSLLPIIGNMDRLREEAHRYGVVLDEAAIQKGGQAADAFNRLDQAVEGLQRNLGSIATDVGIIGFFERLAYWTGQISLNMPELVARTGSLYESLFKLAGLDLTGFRDAFTAVFEGRPALADPAAALKAAQEAAKKTAAQAEAAPSFVGPRVSMAVTTEADEKKAKALEKERQQAAEKAAKARAKWLAELAKQEDAIRDASMKDEEEQQKRLIDLDQEAAAITRRNMEEEERAIKELLDIELRGQQEALEAEHALSAARALSLTPLEAQRQAIADNLAAKEQQIAKLVEEGKITEDVGMQAVTAYREAAAEELKWAEQQELLDKLGEIAGILGQLPGLVEAFGVSADSALGEAVGAFSDIGQSALGFAATLADPSASIFSKISAGIGAGTALIKGITSIFKKPEWKKVGEEAAEALGLDEALSKELSEAIQKTMEDLDLSAGEAALLHITDVMEETGASAEEMAGSIGDLMGGIASGAIPATEGLEQLDEIFTRVRDDAQGVGDAMTLAMLETARATGTLTDSMKAFISEQNQLMAEGAGQIGSAVENLGSKQLAGEMGTRAAQFFGLGFQQAIEEQGLIGAIDSLGDQALSMFEKFKESGNKAAADLVAPFANLEKVLGGDSKISKGLRAQVELLQGMGKVFKGAFEQGLGTADLSASFGAQLLDTFNAMKAGGVDAKTSMTAIKGELDTAIEAARNLGIPLDANTAALKSQAEAMGFAFPVEPMQQVVDLLKVMVEGMGFQLPASAQQTTTAITGISAAAAAAGGEVITSMAAAGMALDGMQTTALQASSTLTGAFQGVGEQLASGIETATGQMAAELLGVWTQAESGLQHFTNALDNLDGKQIDIEFGFGLSGGVRLDLSGLPQLAGGGDAHGPKSGYLAVLHGDERVTPLDGGGRPSRGSGQGRGSWQQTVNIQAQTWGPRRLVNEMDRVRRRNVRSWRSTGG